jgi:hypothetical protein
MIICPLREMNDVDFQYITIVRVSETNSADFYLFYVKVA